MPKILITGNGFDLFHVLPTSYVNLMFILKKIETINFNEKQNTIYYKDIFGKGWIDIEANYKIEEVLFDKQKLKDIQILLKENIWYHYFRNILELSTWIDFEQEIKKALEVILEFFTIVKSRFLENNISLSFSEDTLKETYIFRKLRNLNILKEETQKISIQSIGTQTKKYYTLIDNYVLLQQFDTYLNEQKIIEDLVLSLENFKIIFNNYFIGIVNPFYKAVRTESSFNYLIEKELLSNIEYFFTFNYTSTIENLYKVQNVEYIHGKINADNLKQNIVLGVSEVRENLMKYQAYDFIKYFQKLNQNTQYQFLNPIDKEITESQEGFTFYVWGFSLDESDKNHVWELFKYLENFPNNKLVVFYHKNPKTGKTTKPKLLSNLLHIIKEPLITKVMTNGQLEFIELTKENLEMNLLHKV